MQIPWIVDALEITASQLKNKNLIYVLFNLKEDIVQGKDLVIHEEFPEAFSSTYISMVFGRFIRGLDVFQN